uniref:Uncharacterized protein n=1 Tax=Plectus sambesii TaxID=2011161 RepID=A0A914XKD2_9BILA
MLCCISLQKDARIVRTVVEEGNELLPFTSETKKALKQLWADRGIRQCFDQRSVYQLNDSAKYFLDAVDRTGAKDYRPTEQDILFTRVATTGVVEVRFIIRNIQFRVFDVGGQRSERRKWIHCFDDVNAIIFIAAISEFDQTLREDAKSV